MLEKTYNVLRGVADEKPRDARGAGSIHAVGQIINNNNNDSLLHTQ